MTTEKTMVAIDGTDALAYVILRPGADTSGVVIEAGANGISKKYAAYALRHTAQSWDPDDTVGADVGQQLKAAHVEIEQLKAELERTANSETDILLDCATCSQPAHWIDCPTGGWWAHEVHPEDGHDAAAVEIDLINEIQLLRAELADEQAAHAKTIDNFEGYSEDTADTLSELRARLDAVRTAARAIKGERDSLRTEVEQARSVRTAVLAVMEHYRDAVADASRWSILSDLAIARDGHIPEHLTAA